jgi:hypothetical protein
MGPSSGIRGYGFVKKRFLKTVTLTLSTFKSVDPCLTESGSQVLGCPERDPSGIIMNTVLNFLPHFSKKQKLPECAYDSIPNILFEIGHSIRYVTETEFLRIEIYNPALLTGKFSAVAVRSFPASISSGTSSSPSSSSISSSNSAGLSTASS